MSSRNPYDFIVCGQGIAGTLLAWNLLKAGKKVLVVDEGNLSSSSLIAAGIVIPVTGRRIVKTWMADVCLPEALHTYRTLEKLTGHTFYYEKPVLELLSSAKQKNDWQERASDQTVSGFIEGFISNEKIPPGIISSHGAVQLNQCYRLDTVVFLSAMKNYFISINAFKEGKMKVDDIKEHNNTIHWNDHTASRLVFCTGFEPGNDLYRNIPFQFSKGEIITIKCNELSQDFILNHGIFILPVGDHHFKVGSTYEWEDLTYTPTLSAKEKLLNELRLILSFPFEVVNHEASIRPTIRERRPVIGIHPGTKNTGIMNGLGTKGVLLAPWLASHFCDHLLKGKSLNTEVDLQRFFISR